MMREAKKRTAASRGTTLLQAISLRKFYPLQPAAARAGGKEVLRAVDGVNLSIERQEILGLVGESGCGKSTLGRCLAAVEKPTSGVITYEGRDILKMSRAAFRRIRPRIQLIFQDPRGSFDPRMRIDESVGEPLAVAGLLGRRKREQTVRELLGAVGLHPGYAPRYPSELSGGELQRAAMARAVALNPAFLVADEPVSALDPSIRSQVIDLLLDLGKRFSMSILLIVHDLPLAARVSRRVAVMYLGRLMEIGPSDRLLTNPRHPYSRALIASSSSFKKGQDLIHGEPESPIHIPSGCRFRRRCPEAVEVCSSAEPKLKPVDGTRRHLVACYLAEGSPKTGSF